MKATASDIAKYIITVFHDAGDMITNMKVQKLLYYIQGWHLGVYNDTAFSEELQAWVHGPVQPGVYNEYKDYQWNPISEAVERPQFDEQLTRHIGRVLRCYGGDSAYALENLTHTETPWIEARGDLDVDQPSKKTISVETMEAYFVKRAQDNVDSGNYTLDPDLAKSIEDSRKGIGVFKCASWEEMITQIQQEIKEEENAAHHN